MTAPSAVTVHGAPPVADRFEATPTAPRLAVGVRQGSLRFVRWIGGAAVSTLLLAGLPSAMGGLLTAPPVPDRAASAMLGLRRRGPPIVSL